MRISFNSTREDERMPKKAKLSSYSTVDSIRVIVEALNREKGLKKGELYRLLYGSMTDRLTGYGIANASDCLLVMQELGLLSWNGSRQCPVWEVLNIRFFNQMISERKLRLAQKAVVEHYEYTKLLRQMKQLPENVVAELDRLRRKVARLKKEVRDEARLADTVASRLFQRFKGLRIELSE